MNNTKNYKEQGGDRWVIGGTLEMSDGTHLVIGDSTLEDIIDGIEGADLGDIEERLDAIYLEGESNTGLIPDLDDRVVALEGAPIIKTAIVTLNGINPTRVNFQASEVATHQGTEAETFDLSDNDKTLIVTPDGEAEEVILLNGGQAGRSVSGATASTDISGGVDHKFAVKVDVMSEPVEVSLGALGGLTTTGAIATAIENAINGIEGVSGVTCTYANSKYTITSGMLGMNSSIVITRATSHNITEELELGVADGGTEVGGGGNFNNYAEVSAEEVVEIINSEVGNFVAIAEDDGTISLAGKVDGGSLIVGAGTSNAIFGFTASTYIGAVGLGYDADMEAGYMVMATPTSIGLADKANIKGVAINDKTTTGFELVCDTDASDFDVDLVIVGKEE